MTSAVYLDVLVAMRATVAGHLHETVQLLQHPHHRYEVLGRKVLTDLRNIESLNQGWEAGKFFTVSKAFK